MDFFTLWCEFAYPGLMNNMKRDLSSSAMKACSSMCQLLHTRSLLWKKAHFCGLVSAAVWGMITAWDHPLSQTSSSIWPYDKPCQPQEDVGFQPFFCISYFQPCIHVINTQEAISLQPSLHCSNTSASVPSYVLELERVSVVKVAFSAQTPFFLTREMGNPWATLV